MLVCPRVDEDVPSSDCPRVAKVSSRWPSHSSPGMIWTAKCPWNPVGLKSECEKKKSSSSPAKYINHQSWSLDNISTNQSTQTNPYSSALGRCCISSRNGKKSLDRLHSDPQAACTVRSCKDVGNKLPWTCGHKLRPAGPWGLHNKLH
jgi:hypothetical protein